MASKCDDHDVFLTCGRQRSKDGLRHLCMRGSLIDKKSTNQALNGVGEQGPQRRRVAPGPSQLRD